MLEFTTYFTMAEENNYDLIKNPEGKTAVWRFFFN
jgi:hypothetical protein